MSAYQRALDLVTQNVLQQTVALVAAVWRARTVTANTDAEVERERDLRLAELEEPLFRTILKGRQQAYALAVDRLRETASKQGVASPAVPRESWYDRESLRTALADLDEREDVSARSIQQAAQQLGLLATRHTLGVARQVAVDAVEGDEEDMLEDGERPVRWARVLVGAENCGFCVMLASRGGVYEDREIAQIAQHGKRAELAYHDGCDCDAEPVYDPESWAGAETAQRLYDLYLAAAVVRDDDGNPVLDKTGKPETYGDKLNALRRYMAAHPGALDFIDNQHNS